MSLPISSLRSTAANGSFGTTPETSKNRSAVAPSFVRSNDIDAAGAPLQAGGARKAQAVPDFGAPELKRMGAEILSLYKEKFLDQGKRYLDFSSEGKKYSIRGSDIENVLIHTDDGLVQLGGDGTPRPNPALPVADKQAMNVALMRTLATLRNVEPA